MRFSRLVVLCALPAYSIAAASPSPLMARGYAILPDPQRVTLGAGDFPFGPNWHLERRGVAANDVAIISLNEGLGTRFNIKLTARGGGTLTLVLAPGSVAIGDAVDSDKPAIASQAYKIDLHPTAIT